MSAQVALIIAGLAFLAAAIVGGGKVLNVELPELPAWARVTGAVVGLASFTLGLVPGIYTPSSVTASSSPAGTSTRLSPSARHITPTPQPSTRAPAASGDVSIDHPGFGAKVGACAVFSGKADLLPGETLVLSALNLSDPAKVLYLQAVNDWDLPADLTHWTGYQYFGSGDSSLGQAFEVSVIVMKIRTVTAILAEPANRPIWHVKSLPNDSEVKQTLRVIRMKGSGPAVCH
jgi:hypothetical protein